jgi:hypothetical protein
MAETPGPPEFTRAEISGAISRALLLPPELQGVVDLTGRLEYIVNHDPQLRAAGLQGDGFRTLLFNNLSPDLAQMLDPAKREAALREQAMRDNPMGAVHSSGQPIHGRFLYAGGNGGGAAGNGGGAGTSSNSFSSKWELEGTPLQNRTGLDTVVYSQLRSEGYSQAQIGAAAGDLSKIRSFTPADVSRYTPYFVDTSEKFRKETKGVVESNGAKKFEESDSVTEGNAQAELIGGHKIEHGQANSLGQLIYDSGIDREALRRQQSTPGQPREGARKKFLSDYMREHYNGFDVDEFQRLLKVDPKKAEEYRNQHKVPQDGKRTEIKGGVAAPQAPASSKEVSALKGEMASLLKISEANASPSNSPKSTAENTSETKSSPSPEKPKAAPIKDASAKLAAPAHV